MANELQHQNTVADLTVKAVIRNGIGAVWQTTTETFVTFVDANVDNYGVALTEQGTSSGFYVGNFPTAITAAGTYTVVLYSQTGETLSVDPTNVIAEGEIVWDGSAEVVADGSEDLITLPYFKTFAGVSGTTNDDRYEALITAASKAITSYCNKRFKAASYTDYYDGGGRWSLLLKRYPITSLTRITLWPYDSGSTEVIDGNDYIVDNPTGEIQLKTTATGTSVFPCGFQTVKAEYEAGYATVPEDIQAACAMLVRNLFNTAQRDSTVAGETIGKYSYTNSTTVATEAITANADIKAMLDKHRDYGV